MRFELSDEQEMLRESIRGALARDATPARVRAWAESGEWSAFDELAAQQSWEEIGIAEEDGGQGGGLVELAVLFEELGRAAAPSGRLLARCGGANLPSGRPPDEPGAFEVDGGLLTGRAELVLDAPGAERLVIPVTSGETVALWAVDAAHPGVTVQSRALLDATRRFADLELEAVPAELLREEDPSRLAARAAVMVAAESLGLARAMLAMTVDYVGERVQFRVPVGSFQAVKHAAAQTLVEIEAAHSGVYYAAWAVEHGAGDALEHAWIAKAFATETAAKAADTALFLHGAIAYTWEHDLQLWFKRAKLNRELLGPPGVYWDRVAGVLELSADPVGSVA